MNITGRDRADILKAIRYILDECNMYHYEPELDPESWGLCCDDHHQSISAIARKFEDPQNA